MEQSTHSGLLQKSTRILFGIAAERDWEVHHLDITAAYLVADIDEDVFLEIPEYLEEFIPELKEHCKSIPSKAKLKNNDYVCKLHKSIYGLHQSGRLWNEHLDAFLKSQKLLRSRADPCVYYFKGRDLIVTTYVDDIILYGTNDEINKLKEALKKTFEVIDLGKAKHILSMRVNKTDDAIRIDQSTYVVNLLKEMNMLDRKSVSSPLSLGVKYKSCETGQELDEKKANVYRKVIGSFLYLATHTRPDLAFASTYMSQFSQQPSREHWTGMMHMLRYLNGKRSLALEFKKTGVTVEVYTDADWGSDITDRRSFSGYVIKLGGAPVSWSSRKQRCVALSTVEAEFVALSEVGKECTWIRHFLEEIGQSNFVSTSITVHIDNQGAMKLAENHTTSDRSKHIDFRMFHVRELIENKELKLVYVKTGENLADQLTKVLPSPRMHEHLIQMGIVDPGGVLDIKIVEENQVISIDVGFLSWKICTSLNEHKRDL